MNIHKDILFIIPHHCPLGKNNITVTLGKDFNEVGSSVMNISVDNLITTSLASNKTLSGNTKLIKLLVLFTGELIIFLPWYINLKSFIHGNTDWV